MPTVLPFTAGRHRVVAQVPCSEGCGRMAKQHRPNVGRLKLRCPPCQKEAQRRQNREARVRRKAKIAARVLHRRCDCRMVYPWKAKPTPTPCPRCGCTGLEGLRR